MLYNNIMGILILWYFYCWFEVSLNIVLCTKCESISFRIFISVSLYYQLLNDIVITFIA